MSSEPCLQPIGEKGRTAGLRNMLRKENARWWNLRSILIQVIIWLVIINSIVAFVIFILPLDPTVDMSVSNGETTTAANLTHDKLAEIGISLFFGISSFAIAIGAIILCHDSILKERETGTAAWILSKPVSRRSFVLSKFIANCIGMLALIVLLQGALAYTLCSLRQGAPVDVLPFIVGLALLSLCCLFYGFLAIAIGTLTNSRTAALAVPLIVLLGDAITYMIPQLGMIMPWKLGQAAGDFAVSGILSTDALLPIVTTVIWIALFVIAAIWKFERIEL